MRADKRDGAPTTQPSITHPLTEAGKTGRERPPKTSAADSSIGVERNAASGAFDVRRKIRRANARQLGETFDVNALLLCDVRRSILRRPVTCDVRAGRTDANLCTVFSSAEAKPLTAPMTGTRPASLCLNMGWPCTTQRFETIGRLFMSEERAFCV